MNHSISSDALKTERYFDEETLFNQRKVKVYIRTVTRKSIKIQLPAQIALDQLKEIIWKKFSITHQNQVMYLKGTCLNYNIIILLQNNWIIHVINLAEVHLPEIAVEIKAASLCKKINTISKICVSPKITIKKFINDHILSQYEVDADQILLVESGRILRQNGTFSELNIQNGTTINLIHSKKDQSSLSSLKTSIYQTKPKVQITQNSDIKSQTDSVKTIEKGDWKYQNFKKNTSNNICSLHDKQPSLQRVLSQKNLTCRESSITQRQYHDCSNIKNISTQVGQRQCNCKKQKQTTHQKQAKFITIEDKKRLSKQIREQNLQKLMRTKQKKQEQLINSPTTQRKMLLRVRSLGQLKPTPLRDRKKSFKPIKNPQKYIKC